MGDVTGNFAGNIGTWVSERGPDRIPRPERCDRIALVLQGGGALGAYQGGVYQALQEVGLEPDWVAGVSIGAINGAIIAGNPPEPRVERLRAFWERITERKVWHYTPDGDIFRKARNFTSSWLTITQGQPGFFTPHHTKPWLSFAGSRTATSYYDNTPLRETLLELVDFERINRKDVRLAVGAVNVLDGNFVYFDSARNCIAPEHVMASGALLPALPMVKIGTDHFWDGGIVSNTPLQHLLDQDDKLNEEERRLRAELSDLPDIAILHLIYQQKSYEGHAKDYEFSGTSMREHWQSGYEDTMRTLKHRVWIAMPPEGQGVVVHDVHREDGL